jgi:hypothetical protein
MARFSGLFSCPYWNRSFLQNSLIAGSFNHFSFPPRRNPRLNLFEERNTSHRQALRPARFAIHQIPGNPFGQTRFKVLSYLLQARSAQPPAQALLINEPIAPPSAHGDIELPQLFAKRRAVGVAVARKLQKERPIVTSMRHMEDPSVQSQPICLCHVSDITDR